MTPSPRRPSPPPWRRSAALGLLVSACILGALLLAAHQEGSVEGEPYVEGFSGEGALNVMLIQGDGQAYAALAQDPTLARPERFSGSAADVPSEAEAAYRAQRPLLPLAAWVLSAGQPGLVNPALLVLAALGATLLVAATALVLADRGDANPLHALVVLALPASLASLSWLGPDLAAVGLALLGYRRWPSSRWAAVAGFGLAALLRETALLVAAGLAAHTLLVRREVRPALQLAWSALPLAVVVVLVHQRVGAWPWDAGAGRMGLPFTGIVEALDRWSVGDGLHALALLALAGLAVTRWRDPLAWVVLVTAAFATLLGWDVWKDMRDVGRVVLPAFVAGLILLLAPLPAATEPDRRRRPAGRSAASSPAPPSPPSG